MSRVLKPERDQMSENGLLATDNLLRLLVEYEEAKEEAQSCPEYEGGWDVGRGERAINRVMHARNSLTRYMHRVGFFITNLEKVEDDS